MVRRHANTDTRFSIDNQPLLPRAAGLDEHLLDEGSVRLEDPNPVRRPVAHVDQAVIGGLGAINRSPELLCRRGIRIERAQGRVGWLVAIRAPVAQKLSSAGVHDDDSLVAVPVSHEGFVPVLVEGDLRHPGEVGHAVGVDALSRLPHLHQKTAVPGELQHMGVALAIPADPDVVLGIHLKTMVRGGPRVIVAGATEGAHQVARWVELQDVGGRLTTLRGRLIRPDVAFVARIQALPAVHDENVIPRIDPDTDGVAQEPVVR